jgi:hypothetical protein
LANSGEPLANALDIQDLENPFFELASKPHDEKERLLRA